MRVGFELKLVGRKHPHLIQIFDGGRCPKTDFLFLVMEYLPYDNLDDLQGKIPFNKIPQIADQLAQAARYLEEIDICHRDIKPENIVITPDFEQIILLDLGILRPLVEDHQDAGTGCNFIGTVRYSPPEFVWRVEEEDAVGHRAITFYQIGAVLHDLIMRRRMRTAEQYSTTLAAG
ncbi:protein kinase domain-containing protein [Novosphingobium decolorationis]|uniref:protein kinase domain-containing protein n=1 Tax=Novosphingobium decolorationis TaxID=2698673 RepID=UPI0024110EF5|nr:protein kinase [Novosphingobium decolorationis]